MAAPTTLPEPPGLRPLTFRLVQLQREPRPGHALLLQAPPQRPVLPDDLCHLLGLAARLLLQAGVDLTRLLQLPGRV